MKTLLKLLILSSLFIATVYADVITYKTPFKGSVLLKPNDDKSYPGVMLLHGSEGGSIPYTRTIAQALANEGFSVLSFCWFDCANNIFLNPIAPLIDVPLEKSFKAFNWLKSSKFVDGKKSGIYGFSRGAEQALILASLSELEKTNISAIAVHAPSDTIVGGFSWAWFDKRCWVCKQEDDKACADREKTELFKWNTACGTNQPPDESGYKSVKAWTYGKKALNIGDMINIESYQKPLYISHGSKDHLWSFERSKRIVKKLKKHKQPVQAHFVEGAGHVFRFKDAVKEHQLVTDFFKNNLSQ
ncbi:putative thioesterase [uncultured Candidatus Thioglobus sp.]|nr:putative thioesterase [uncultured Candidatus Thioglobus sp.]